MNISKENCFYSDNDLLLIAASAAIEAGNAIMDFYRDRSYTVTLKSDESPVTTADIAANQIILDRLATTKLPVLSEEIDEIPFSIRREWERFWLVDPLDGTREFISSSGDFTVNIALIENNASIAGVIYAPVYDALYFGSMQTGSYRLLNASRYVTNNFLNIISRSEKLPLIEFGNIILTSRTHPDIDTTNYIKELLERNSGYSVIERGSSIKFCLIAEGSGAVYPRVSSISEWDTAAGHAIVNGSGGVVTQFYDDVNTLLYNKERTLNPGFIAYRKGYTPL